MRYLVSLSLMMLSLALVQPAIAKDAANGDEFRATAVEYDQMADKMRAKGHDDIARSYEKLAKIKRNAGKLADQGKWDEISWDEYFAISKDIEANRTQLESQHKKH